MKLWAIQWDHGEPIIKYNLLRFRELRYGLAVLLMHWSKCEIRVEAFGLRRTIKGLQEGSS